MNKDKGCSGTVKITKGKISKITIKAHTGKPLTDFQQLLLLRNLITTYLDDFEKSYKRF